MGFDQPFFRVPRLPAVGDTARVNAPALIYLTNGPPFNAFLSQSVKPGIVSESEERVFELDRTLPTALCFSLAGKTIPLRKLHSTYKVAGNILSLTLLIHDKGIVPYKNSLLGIYIIIRIY